MAEVWFVTSSLGIVHTKPLLKKALIGQNLLPWQNLLPMGEFGNKLFSFRVDSFSERDKIILIQLPPLKVYQIIFQFQ